MFRQVNAKSMTCEVILMILTENLSALNLTKTISISPSNALMKRLRKRTKKLYLIEIIYLLFA